MNYKEFFFLLPIWDLTDSESDENCHEISLIFHDLGITIGNEFINDKYDSFNDPNGGGYPLSRSGKGNVIILFSDKDIQTFVMFDMFNGCTDQHNMVEFGIRCKTSIAEKILPFVESLYNKGEPRSKFQEGDLLLTEKIDQKNYPKEINDCGNFIKQKIEFYQNGKKLNNLT